jgi:hypothetical protein
VDWIHLAKARDWWRVFVHTVMTLQASPGGGSCKHASGSTKGGKFLA